MKFRILPTEEFAEYGKTDTVVMILSINPTEASRILDNMFEGMDLDQDSNASADYLAMVLRAIAERSTKTLKEINNG